MRVRLHRTFEKQFKKLRPRDQKQAKERLVLFACDAFDPILNNHPLHGKYQNCRSINITGDLRAIYRETSRAVAYFIALGTHGKLYS